MLKLIFPKYPDGLLFLVKNRAKAQFILDMREYTLPTHSLMFIRGLKFFLYTV